MISIDKVTKEYNGKKVLDITGLQLDRGEVVGVVGNNGAGKTTFFSLILDLIKPSTGAILSQGSNVMNSEIWKSYTSAYLDESFLINFLTPEEYFQFVGGLYQMSDRETIDFVQQFESVFSDEILGKKKYIRDLSKGNQKKVGLVGSLIGNPEVIIWDEPFSNLDPKTQLRIRELTAHRREECLFLISSHDLSHIMEVCTRVIILDKGLLLKDVKCVDTSLDELYKIFTSDRNTVS